ncbi:MAG: hypothetical protein N4A33_11685 [Bacteriovoracaceae bacterium]|jgi:catalase (peroxidase I)|nr:hypothetical protein [Bacteriovoracaceae bacterium]
MKVLLIFLLLSTLTYAQKYECYINSDSNDMTYIKRVDINLEKKVQNHHGTDYEHISYSFYHDEEDYQKDIGIYFEKIFVVDEGVKQRLVTPLVTKLNKRKLVFKWFIPSMYGQEVYRYTLDLRANKLELKTSFMGLIASEYYYFDCSKN